MSLIEKIKQNYKHARDQGKVRAAQDIVALMLDGGFFTIDATTKRSSSSRN